MCTILCQDKVLECDSAEGCHEFTVRSSPGSWQLKEDPSRSIRRNYDNISVHEVGGQKKKLVQKEVTGTMDGVKIDKVRVVA